MTTSKPVRLMSELRGREDARVGADLATLQQELERAYKSKLGIPAAPDPRRLAWERAQVAAVLVASAERRRRRLSFALWLAIVAFSVVALVVTYRRCFGH